MSDGTVILLVVGGVLCFAVSMAAFFVRLVRKSAREAERAAAAQAEARGRAAHSGFALANVVGLGHSHAVGAAEVLVEMTLEVRPPGAREYRARATWLVDLASLPQVQPGLTLQVKVDPDDPQRIYPAAEWARYRPGG
jgi:hypothetical protein